MPAAQAFYSDGSPIPEADLSRALQSGEANYPAGSDVELVDKFGNRQQIKAEKVGDYLAAGFQVEGAARVESRELADKYGTAEQAALAGVEGLGRGLTLGLSDVAAGALGADTEAMYRRREEHSTVSNVSELAGAIAPALVTGGASGAAGLAARGATALPRAAMAAGRAVEGAAARRLGGGLSARVAAGVAGGAAEGALQGAGQGLSDAVLEQIEDPALFAQKVFAGGAGGALFGGVLGAPLGALKKARGPLSLADDIAPPPAARIASEAADEMRAVKRGLTGETAEAALEAAPARGWAARQAEKSAVNSLTGNYLRQTAQAERIGVDKIGRKLLNSGVPLASPVKAAAAAGTLADDAGKRMQAVAEQVDVRIDPQRLLQRVDEQTAALRAIDDPDVHKIAKKIEKKTDLIRRRAGGAGYSFEEMWKLRQQFDRGIDWQKAANKGQDKALRELRDNYSAVLTEAVEGKSPELAAQWKSAAEDYLVFKFAKDSAENLATRRDANRAFSLTDYVSGGAGMTPGGIAIGLVTGNPVAGMIGGAATGLAQAAMNKTLRERGPAMMARMLDSVSNSELSLGNSVAGLVGRAGTLKMPAIRRAAVPAAVKGAQLAGRYRERVDAVRENQDPEKLAEKLSAIMGATHEHPQIAFALVQHAQRANEYLAQRVPEPSTRDRASLTPQAEDARTSAADMRKFLRISRALEAPFSVLEDLERGKLDFDALDAVKTTSPELFAELQSRVVQEAQRREEPLSFRQRNMLSLAFDLPAENSLRPEILDIIQSSGAAPAEPEQATATDAGGGIQINAAADQMALGTP